MDAPPTPGHRCGRPRAQPDQRLEGSYYHGQQEVRLDQSCVSGIAVVVAKGPVSLILKVSCKKTLFELYESNPNQRPVNPKSMS